MARVLRIEYEGAIYHAMARGNNGQSLFKNDSDREMFLGTLGEVCKQTGWIIHSYVLMNNHYHLLLETPEANLVAGMRWFQQTYTQRFNRRHKRSGHLYQGRYKAPLIQPDEDVGYFLEVSTYIHLNPFRARLVGWPEKPPLSRYRWSSYLYFAGTNKNPPEWLTLNRVYNVCGWSSRNRQVGRMYQTMLRAKMAYERDPVNQEVVEQAHREIRTGWYTGDPKFRDELAELLPDQRVSDNFRGSQRRDHGVSRAEQLLHHAVNILKINEEELLARRSTDLEKQGVAWLLKAHTTVTGQWIATRLNMGHRVNASRAISSFSRRKDKRSRKCKKKLLQCTG